MNNRPKESTIAVRGVPWIGCLCLLLVLQCRSLRAFEIEMPVGNPLHSIQIEATSGFHWKQGSYDVWHLFDFRLKQGKTSAESSEAIIWVEHQPQGSEGKSRVLAYLEQNVKVDYGRTGPQHNNTGQTADSVRALRWLSRFQTSNGVRIETQDRGPPRNLPAIFDRANKYRDDLRKPDVQLAQFTAQPTAPPSIVIPTNPNAAVTPGVTVAPGAAPIPGAIAGQPAVQPEPVPRGAIAGGATPYISTGMQDVYIESQNTVGFSLTSDPDAITGGYATVCNSGVRVTIRDLRIQDEQLGTVTLFADHVIVWHPPPKEVQRISKLPPEQRPEIPVEVYLEGNIILRQGRRIVYAKQMYYDVVRKNGTVLNAELLSPVQDYPGLVRLKADVLKQVNEHNFVAYGAAITTSRMGYPRYWLQTEQMEVQDRPFTTSGPPTVGPDGVVRVQQQAEHDIWATSKNNFVHIGGLPVFYWPYIRTNVRKPTYYLDRVRIRDDSVFGTQILLDWDAFQLFGIRKREGVDWTLSTDFLSDRGFGLGTNVTYDRPGPLFGFGGRYRGLIDAWAIRDTGLDNLGADRRALVPEEEYRGRLLTRHQQELGNGFYVQSETGFISDRNFLEQYYEQEWDEWKDQDTRTMLKRYVNSRMWQIQLAGHINDFHTETSWLPRFDHYSAGLSLFDRLTWYEHSHIGYGEIEVATTPTDPTDAAKFRQLAWETPAKGVRAASRQELDFPFEIGPVKMVPYVLGEVAYWEQDVNRESVTRAYGQTGIRANLPMWKVDPGVQNPLLNLNGLAHKVDWRAEFLYADASEDVTRFPLYDRLDDNNVEHFRRRYPFDLFAGAPIPMRYDERNFAFRSGLQRWVSSPSTEIVDDLMQARLGLNQRWQTKRGLPGQERIVDWMVLDIEGTLFPKSGRDNFGQEFGMLDYDYRWHLGDRFTILSDGYADLFGGGLRTISIGASLNRPDRGTLYVGYRSLEGPFSSNIFNAVLDYRLSEKWIATASTTFDLGETGNIGQFVGLTRIGESALVRVGFSVDESRGNVSARITVEPRVFPNGRLGRVAGTPIPPPGVLGLE